MYSQMILHRTLQNQLQASYVETQSMIKEMEMLNLMFAELEHVGFLSCKHHISVLFQHIFTQQTKGTGDIEVTENGQVVKVKDVSLFWIS